MASRRVRLIFVAIPLLVVLVAAVWAWTPDLDRATLERKYLASPDDLVSVGGTILHVRDTGPRAGPAVILLHGFGSSLHTWEPWAEALAADRLRVIRFDLPGAGLSPPDSTGDYTDRRSLALLLALMERLEIRHASLVGNSIGGRIAWRFAAEHPERVDRLVLVSPDGFASPGFDYGRPPKVPAVFEVMRYVLPKPVLRMNLEPAYAERTRLTESILTRYEELLRAPGVRGALLERMRQTALVDPHAYLGRIRAPTLLLWGRHDRLIPFANSDDYLRAIPGSRLVALEDTGHVPQEEIPEASLAPVRDFLEKR